MTGFAARLGPRLLDQLLGVVLPGLVILCEVWLIANWGDIEQSESVIDVASEQTAGANLFVAALGTLVVLFAAYALGALVSSLVWSVWRMFMRRRPLSPVVSRDLVDTYTETFVNEALKAHPVLKHVLSVRPDRQYDPMDGGVLSYCKLWLRSREAALGVDHFEREITLLMALVAPLWGAAFIALPALGSVWFVGALLTSGLLTGALFRLVRVRQRDELFQAVKHFFFAQWYVASEPIDRRSA